MKTALSKLEVSVYIVCGWVVSSRGSLLFVYWSCAVKCVEAYQALTIPR